MIQIMLRVGTESVESLFSLLDRVYTETFNHFQKLEKNIYYSKLIHLTKQSIKTFIYDILLVFYQSTRRLLFYRFRLLFDSNVKK